VTHGNPETTPITDEHYRRLFDALDQGFCTIEVLFDASGAPSDYRFIDVNGAFEQQTGLRNAIGRRMRELAPAHEEHWFRTYGQVATTGRSVRFEHQAAALGRWFDVYAFRIGDPALRHVAILFRDITLRRRAELAADSARREAVVANRAKDEFLAMLGHELRNPLAPMLTALQLMRLRGLHSREQDVLERQVHHLTRMVDDLLDVARIVRGRIELQRQSVELAEVVLSAMEMAGPLLEQRQHSVEMHVPQHGAGVDGDPGRLAQVVSNLLTNAAKYSEPGSRIVVTGSREREMVRISVRDEGIGLTPDMLTSVFEPFVQHIQALDRASGGLGLGLAIVRNIVAAHGGRAWAESAGLTKGAEFIVEIPASASPSSEQWPETSTPAAVMSPATRVLVVDDNQDAAELLRVALELLGCTADVAFDGLSALVRAAAFSPTSVLVDIGLPGIDGYEVARRLRANPVLGTVRLIAVTGYGQQSDRDRAREAGFDHHLVKPIDLQQLQVLLRETPPPSH